MKRVLQDHDFVLDHQTGSHQRYTDAKTGISTTLPHHKELKPKTAKSILADISKTTNQTIPDLIKKYALKL